MRAPVLLRTNRDFRLLWIGESVSELGTTVTYVALPFVALIVLHATTFEVAALAAVETIFWPFIALPIGVWVDRVSRRRVLLVADGGRVAAGRTCSGDRGPLARGDSLQWAHAEIRAPFIAIAGAVGVGHRHLANDAARFVGGAGRRPPCLCEVLQAGEHAAL